jgi:prepilin-type N-terminal cleavage/methylation domain-containing protein/prepilin-type processing-associated H-X9-DG protein
VITSSSRKQPTSAFTLIELLVVIAIIAILAAILFPVFAQARQSARGASSQSNMKQLSLAILMYVQDYDETYPLYNRWGDPSSPVSIGLPFSNWGYDIAPYIKNRQVFIDPCFGPHNTADIFFPVFSTYGYNYVALSPTLGGAIPWVETPANLAAIARPADIVLLAGIWDSNELFGSQNTVIYYGPGTIIGNAGAEVPDCSHVAPFCFTDWATGGNYNGLPTEESGKYTGGVSLRKAKNSNIAHCDGHVKFMQAGQAAVGTNWFKGITAGNVKVTNNTVYKWEQSP